MGDKYNSKIIYSIIGNSKIIYKLQQLNNISKELKIITNKNISNFYYIYKINFGNSNINIYDISTINKNDLEDIIVEHFKCENNNILLLDKEDKLINFNGIDITKVKLCKKDIDRIMQLDFNILFDYILKEYFKKLYIKNANDNLTMFISDKTSINKLGEAILSVFSEYSSLSINKEIIINVISGERLYLDTLAYITDPILEYTDINAKVTINNVIQEDLSNNFIINILGAF